MDIEQDIDNEYIDEESLKLLATYSTTFDAELLKGNLEGADIKAHILSQVDTTRNFTLGALAVVKVFVHEDDYEDAKLIMNDINNTNFEFEDENFDK